MKYEVVIDWSPEDQAFVAEVPDLPGCMTHGDTYEEALAMAQDAMAGWIEAWTAMGRPVPEPRRRVLSA